MKSPQVVGFQAQPEAFDGIEIRAVGGQEAALKMMPVQPLGFVPARVVDDEDAPFAGIGRDGFGEVIQEALEAVGIHAVEDHGKALAGGGRDGSRRRCCGCDRPNTARAACCRARSIFVAVAGRLRLHIHRHTKARPAGLRAGRAGSPDKRRARLHPAARASAAARAGCSPSSCR